MISLSLSFGATGGEMDDGANRRIVFGHFAFHNVTVEQARDGMRPCPGLAIVMPRPEQESFSVNGEPLVLPPGAALVLNGESHNVLLPTNESDLEGRSQSSLGVIEINASERVMVFITNNLEWAPGSIADIYKARWTIEVFFKQIKQTLQIADFLGYNENAVRWQVWTAMTAYLLQRFLAHLHGWQFSFPRICTVLRSVLWGRFDIVQVIKSCGTAGAPKRLLAAPDQGFLPGFAPVLCDSS